MDPAFLLRLLVIGLGATLAIDLWALFLRRALGVRSLDYCLLGRWALYLPAGVIAHQNIGQTPPRRHECPAGWALHYLIGTGFAFAFALLVGRAWFANPTPFPALAYGAATVVVPLFTMQPAFGLGIAASKTARPNQARLKSLATHTVFGAGLFACAAILS